MVPQPSGPTINVADKAINKEMDDSLVRAANSATSLDAEQDRGNINKTRSKATVNEPSSPGTSSGGGPRHQETMGDTIAQTRFENISKHSNDPLLKKRSRTHGLKRLYKVDSSRRVEYSDEEGLGEEDASKQGRIADIDANEDIYLVNVQTDEDMFGVNDLDGDEVIVDSVDVVNTTEETRSVVEEVTGVTIQVSVVTTTTTVIADVEITLAQALAELKSAKPKADKVVIQEPEQCTTTPPTLTTTTHATTITTISTRPRAKGLVIHEQEQAPTPTVFSQQLSQVKVQDKLQANKEEERFAREKAQQMKEANIAWDDVPAKINADYQLAQRVQAQE
ncbi:hypothetical protein Tco_1064511 [Tanacetum coccineum]